MEIKFNVKLQNDYQEDVDLNRIIVSFLKNTTEFRNGKYYEYLKKILNDEIDVKRAINDTLFGGKFELEEISRKIINQW